MATLENRDGWRALKAKYGIPDAVCKFSMGEKLGAFAKKEDSLKGDVDGQADAFDEIIPLLTTYNTALKTVKPSKFKGKTDAEKNANFGKAKDAVQGILNIAKAKQGQLRMLARPLKHVADYLPAVIAKYKSISPDDKSAITNFYGQEVRNTLGLAIQTALKGGLHPDIKTALTKYEESAGKVDRALNHPDPNAPVTPKALYAEIGKALAQVQLAVK